MSSNYHTFCPHLLLFTIIGSHFNQTLAWNYQTIMYLCFISGTYCKSIHSLNSFKYSNCNGFYLNLPMITFEHVSSINEFLLDSTHTHYLTAFFIEYEKKIFRFWIFFEWKKEKHFCHTIWRLNYYRRKRKCGY